MPNPSRQKGDRFERQCIHDLAAHGVKSRRVPLSGSAGGVDTDDLIVDVCGKDERIECKVRKRAWGDLYDWLKAEKHLHPPYALFIKRDRDKTLVVMSLDEFARLSKGIL